MEARLKQIETDREEREQNRKEDIHAKKEAAKIRAEETEKARKAHELACKEKAEMEKKSSQAVDKKAAARDITEIKNTILTWCQAKTQGYAVRILAFFTIQFIQNFSARQHQKLLLLLGRWHGLLRPNSSFYSRRLRLQLTQPK